MIYDQATKTPAHEQPSFKRLKSWVEQRLLPRKEINLPVLVLQGTQVQSAILVDLTETGFGLSNVTYVTPDRLISVALPDGRVFEGRVVWAKDGRAGVVLSSCG